MGTRSTGTGAAGLRVAVALGAVAAIVLGAIGFASYLPTRAEFAGARWWDVVYYTMQLFVLDSTPLDVPQRYPWPLEVARFLAPAITVLAVIETIRVLMWDRYRRWRIAHGRNHVVIAGNDPVALMLARRFAAAGERVALIGDAAGEERHNIHVVPGDPTQEATLRAAGAHRAATVYACGQDSGTNLIVAVAAHRIATRPVTVQAEMRDAALFSTLKTARGPAAGLGFWLNFFVVEDLAARALLGQECLVDGYDENDPMVVFGDTPFGNAVTRQLTDRGARVTQVAEHDATAWAPTEGTPRLYVCLADNELAVRTAFSQAHDGRCRRVVLCLRQRSALDDALSNALLDDAGGRLAAFGILDAACEAAPRDHLDELGRALHEQYVRFCLERGETPATNPSLVPWDRLPHHLKQSNRAQADHIGTKLATIGCAIVPAVPGATPFAYRDGEVDLLARLEHQRWVAERRAAGFVHGPVRDDKAKTHPDLVDWEYLSQHGRDKDIEFVRRIPELLEDAGFQIHRL